MLNRRSTFAIVVAVLFCTSINNADASPFQPGDFITYHQTSWGEPTFPGGMTIIAHYDSVYASTFGTLEVGIPGVGGHSIMFSSGNALLSYLPSTGIAGSLNADLVDPLSSVSGVFGGEVTALHLNIDFSDAGHTLGSLGIPFGDLVIHDLSELPQWNGLTVRDVLPQLDILLGGGTTGYSLAVANLQAFNLNNSFADADGIPLPWAQEHLAPPPVSVPEPSTIALLAIGLLMLSALPFKRKSRS